MRQKSDNLDASPPVMGTEKTHTHFYVDDIILVSLVRMAIKHWWAIAWLLSERISTSYMKTKITVVGQDVSRVELDFVLTV